jgi:hypothetical protein
VKVKVCCICKQSFEAGRHWDEACGLCEPVRKTCCTSVAEAVRHEVPTLTTQEARQCLAYEQQTSKRHVLITALERRLRKLAKTGGIA